MPSIFRAVVSVTQSISSLRCGGRSVRHVPRNRPAVFSIFITIPDAVQNILRFSIILFRSLADAMVIVASSMYWICLKLIPKGPSRPSYCGSSSNSTPSPIMTMQKINGNRGSPCLPPPGRSKDLVR